jgi:diguanylate cyclase (GGDEF)-like protein
METSDYLRRIAQLERENSILQQKLKRSIEDRTLLEEILETHSNALKNRNAELEESREMLKKSEARYRFLANHDSLTELPNRILFDEKLSQAIVCARETNTWIALLFIDLDRFKDINDTYGHEVGDILLNQSANRLLSCIRMLGMLARLGGDEFAILLEKSKDFCSIEKLCRQIIKTMSTPFVIMDHSCFVGVSIGISLYPLDDTKADGLLQKADAAMYIVKKSGANNFRFYRDCTCLEIESMGSKQRRRVSM